MTSPFILSASIADARLNQPEWAREALLFCEANGIDLLMLGRADALPFDAVVIASWAAPLLRRMGVASCITTGLGHPFHAARALSSIDFLSDAKAAWCPLPSHGDPAEKAADFAAAARALWDGWSADTMIIDKQSGRYLDASSVRVPGYEGPFYKVRGPVNAARPPQGHPVMVTDDAAPFTLPDIDIALVSDPGAGAPVARKTLLKISDTPDPRAVREMFDAGIIAGVHLVFDDIDELHAVTKVLAQAFAELRPAMPEGSSLRQRLGLSEAPLPPVAPEKQYAGEGA